MLAATCCHWLRRMIHTSSSGPAKPVPPNSVMPMRSGSYTSVLRLRGGGATSGSWPLHVIFHVHHLVGSLLVSSCSNEPNWTRRSSTGSYARVRPDTGSGASPVHGTHVPLSHFWVVGRAVLPLPHPPTLRSACCVACIAGAAAHTSPPDEPSRWVHSTPSQRQVALCTPASHVVWSLPPWRSEERR